MPTRASSTPTRPLSGLRGKAFAAIDAAGNDDEALQAAVDAASAEIAATFGGAQ